MVCGRFGRLMARCAATRQRGIESRSARSARMRPGTEHIRGGRPWQTRAAMTGTATLLDRLLRDPSRRERVTHVEHVPARPQRTADWPGWVPDLVRDRLRLVGMDRPWTHQAAAADLAWQGRSVVVATGTASGKSLAYLLPMLTAAVGVDATGLYLAPTKALASDQLGRFAR